MKTCDNQITEAVCRLAGAIEAEIQKIEALYRLGYENQDEVLNLENVLEKLLDCAPGVEKCPYCGAHALCAYDEDHDETLCARCARSIPERIVGDEIEGKINGSWVKWPY